MKAVWFISEYYWPVENSTGYIITRIVDKLSEDYKINVITSGDNVENRNSNTQVTRINLGGNLDKNSLLQRIVKQILLSIGYLSKLFKVKKGDTVITVTNPALILFFVAFFKPLLGYKLIIIVHDVFPENTVVAGISKERSLLYRVARKMFNFAYNKGDLLITCGRDMQKVIAHKIGNETKVISIPNFCDTELIFPQAKQENPILKKLCIVDKFVVLFTGNMGRMQGFDNIIEAIKLLALDDEIHFLFIGEGACKKKLLESIEEYNLKNVTCLPNMERERAIEFLNAGDVGLVTLLPNMRGTGVPSKSYMYMAAGKPIVGAIDKDTEIAMMIDEYNVGWYSSPSNHIELSELILHLKKSPNEVIKKGDNSRSTAEKFYTKEYITKLYKKEIEKVVMSTQYK